MALEDRDTLPPDVRAEPELAVFGGIDLAERVFAQAAAWRPGGLVAVEIEESSAGDVAGAAERAEFVDVSVQTDLAGRDRVVTGRMPEER